MSTRTVRDLMTNTVVVARPDTGYKDLIDLMARHEVSAVPVVDGDGKVLGVVSEADLLPRLEFPHGAPHARLFERRLRTVAAKSTAEHAEDLMTSPAVTIGTDATIGEAARVMDRSRVKRLPVVDADGILAGIVSRGDLLRIYLRSDHEVRRDVLSQVVWHVLTEDPSRVEVLVADGVVTLRGMADRRSSAEIAIRLAGAVDGVLRVVDELRWAYDDSVELGRRYIFDAELRR
jgi:CBS domain-containing protein